LLKMVEWLTGKEYSKTFTMQFSSSLYAFWILIIYFTTLLDAVVLPTVLYFETTRRGTLQQCTQKYFSYYFLLNN
jgi:hypothetical protein